MTEFNIFRIEERLMFGWKLEGQMFLEKMQITEI